MRISLRGDQDVDVELPDYVTVDGVLYCVAKAEQPSHGSSWFWPLTVTLRVKSRRYVVSGTLYGTGKDDTTAFITSLAKQVRA